LLRAKVLLQPGVPGSSAALVPREGSGEISLQ
jgi:hypothetical protein